MGVRNIKYAESKDGIIWRRAKKARIDFKSPEENAIARPCVINDEGIYKMWYSFRITGDYRKEKEKGYRLGYAYSDDLINWTRDDDNVGITTTEGDWDSDLIAYAQLFLHDGKKFMFYNGNGFGKSGFGYANLKD